MASAPSTPTMDITDIKRRYPLHLHVWNNEYEDLRKIIQGGISSEDLEAKDCRGRSPLMLAVTLGHLEVARLLMESGADLTTENKQGWTVVQEAVATGDPELVASVLERRDLQRYSSRVAGVPDLLTKLNQAPDFYVEMKWEFTSWVPLVSRMCPSDTYKIYKRGSKVRIDTTLLGFDQNNWHRGNTSFIFQGQRDIARMMEVDHESKQVFVEQMEVINDSSSLLSVMQPSQEAITARLTTPIVTTYVDVDKISFERSKAGMWGWRQDKSEVVCGRNCKVFGASNVQLVTRTRTEHMSESEKRAHRGARTPLQSFLGIAETEERSPTPHEEYTHCGNPCQITPEEYFNPDVDLGSKDIGRPKEITTKIQKFKATLWLCEDYPLSLPEQIMPIVDLMAISSSHFAKLKNFIQMQLPQGFPVKIEIPLFHVLNARITFGNIFALDSEVEGVVATAVASPEDGAVRHICNIDESVFDPPSSYQMLGAESRRQISLDEDDDMLQYAIQQSLLQSGTEQDQVDIWEALQVQRPNTPCYVPEDDEERQLQRAIQASLMSCKGVETPNPVVINEPSDIDRDLEAAIAASQQEQAERERAEREEQAMLELALRRSMGIDD